MRVWITHHLHSLKIALGRLRASGAASLMSVLVIGVALSLPASLYVLLANAQRAAGNVSVQPEITAFLKLDVDDMAAEQMAQALAKRPDAGAVTFVHRDKGMDKLRKAGLGDVMAGLSSNPLPHAITLAPTGADPERIDRLAAELRQHENVEQVSLDANWSRRLAAILAFGRELVWLLAVSLGIALAAIIGNTIRLQIYAQREEIEVSRLIGATDRFIRRPFLYFGLLQGLVGGLAAWGMVSLLIALLDGSVARVALAYGTRFSLAGLAAQEILILLGLACVLGFTGAYLSVTRTLRHFN